MVEAIGTVILTMGTIFKISFRKHMIKYIFRLCAHERYKRTPYTSYFNNLFLHTSSPAQLSLESVEKFMPKNL